MYGAQNNALACCAVSSRFATRGAPIPCFFTSTSARSMVCVATRSAPELGGDAAGRFSDTTAICAQPAKNARHVPAAMRRVRIDVFECLGFMGFRGVDLGRGYSPEQYSRGCSDVPIGLWGYTSGRLF